jgi:hypothetical protein
MHKRSTIYYTALVTMPHTYFYAIVSSSGGSWLVPAKVHKHLNAVLVIYLNFTYVLLLILKYYNVKFVLVIITLYCRGNLT